MQFDFSTWYIVGSLLTHIAPLYKLELDAPLSRHTLKRALAPGPRQDFTRMCPLAPCLHAPATCTTVHGRPSILKT